MCGTPQDQAPERNTRAQLIIKYYFLGKNRICSFWSEKYREVKKQFLLTQEGLLSNQAHIKEDLTVLPENIVLESSKLNYVPIWV